MNDEKFVIEVGREYNVSELTEYIGEIVLIYNDEVVACPCDDIGKDVVLVERIEEVEMDGDSVYLIWVR